MTNAQAAEKYGLAPILNDSYVATLHHSQQRSVGPLFEASTRYHNISNAKKGPLHPYKMELVPTGIHNVYNHNGGRTKNHWAYRKGGR